MTSVIKYSKTDFEKIQLDGFTYNLSPDIIKIIQAIAKQVGSPEYIKTPQFEKRDNYKVCKYKKGRAQEINDEDWNALRSFSVTVINKREGIDASIDQIRKHLNKMTTKTYDSLKDKIIEEIEKIINGFEDGIDNLSLEMKNQLNKIGESIFNIASGNSFYSNMYATLFKELMETFDFMRVIFDTNFEKFRSIFNTIEYCDPNTDYDKFCNNNKVNEQRRAISLFYVNLMLQEVIQPSKIIIIINDLQDYLNKIVVQPNYKSIVDELSEVLYILITNSYEKIQNEDGCEEIITCIKLISEMKPVLVLSISNKTIFKHMDMLDVL
jgi:hypothetical protein